MLAPDPLQRNGKHDDMSHRQPSECARIDIGIFLPHTAVLTECGSDHWIESEIESGHPRDDKAGTLRGTLAP